MQLLISGDYNAFRDGFNGAGVYMASGLFQSQTFERPIYIGSAVDLQERIENGHLASLKKEEWNEKKMATNKPLFHAWKKHGSNSFVWFLLEPCAREDTLEREQCHLDKERPFCDEMRGYNIAHYAASSNKGRKTSDETKAKISAALMGRTKIHSEKHRKKISATLLGRKRTKDSLLKISKTFNLIAPEGHRVNGTNIAEFARANNLNASCLCRVVKGLVPHHKGWTKAV